MSVAHSNNPHRAYYPHRHYTKREIDTVLLAAHLMRCDYCRHYPEAEELAIVYRDKNIVTASESSGLECFPVMELSRRSNLAIALGFYVLSAPVALYFMRLSPIIYVNGITSYMENQVIDWERISFQDTLIAVLLFNCVRELAPDHHEQFLKDLICGIPVPDFYKEDISCYMLDYLNQHQLPTHTLH